MDRIDAMNAFVRMVESGSFTKAASQLDVPKAMVTRLIQGLEQDLKVRLLHRSTRSFNRSKMRSFGLSCGSPGARRPHVGSSRPAFKTRQAANVLGKRALARGAAGQRPRPLLNGPSAG
ncbi:helix-turn-helix domain-containing protein [Variovorax sp. LjRoot84]|uniref:helix-turn-helix domain-containing protein n=1 Tax=Variovorax sp. LjRoot84 TaxID=3342340 RepID=UPI003F51564B